MTNRGIAALLLGIGTLLVLEFTTRWLLDDIGTTGDNTSWFAERWRAKERPLRNSLGFREREFDATPEPGTYRIVVVGDSLIYGQGIAESERLTERLQRALDRHHARFEVLNFGQPGAEYEQNIMNLELALSRAKPDFVLLSWFLNDISDPEAPPPRIFPLLPKLHYFINPRSALYFVLNNAWSQIQIGLGMADLDGWYKKHYSSPDTPLAQRARERLERLLRLPRAEGLPVAMILWPPTLVSGHDAATYDFIFERVLETCESEGVPCLDLRAAFAKHVGENLIVNRFDAHPNGRANEIAAEAVLRTFGERWRTLAERKASGGRDDTGPETTANR